MWSKKKDDISCSTIWCVISGTFVVPLVWYLATVRTADCNLSSCVVVDDKCVSRGVEFKCYASQVSYSFLYRRVQYEYSYLSTQKTDFDHANATCTFINSALKNDSSVRPIPQICRFRVYDVGGTIGMGDAGISFFVWVLVGCVLVCTCTSCYKLLGRKESGGSGGGGGGGGGGIV